jgi:O-antigen/teichoic acid export membrane protein
MSVSTETLQIKKFIDVPSSGRRVRGRLFRLAVTTSVGNKVASAAIQLTAMPLAARTLGAEQFGVYATLAASLGWIALAGVGVAPGLTLGIATSSARRDRDMEARYFSCAFFLTVAIALVLASILTALFILLSVDSLFGERYGAYAAEIRPGISILGVLLLLQSIASVPESARAGYQDTYITNIYNMIGNILTIPCLVAVTVFAPSISGIILSVYGTPLVARLGNAVQLVARDRPYLLPRVVHLDRGVLMRLLSVGMAFTLVLASGVMLYQFSVVIVGRSLGPVPVAGFAVLIQFLTLAFSMIGMIGQPLWPAIAEAADSGDDAWVRASLRRFLTLTILFACTCGATISLFGTNIITLMYGKTMVPGNVTLFFMGLYFVLSIWENALHLVLLGLRQVWWPALAVAGRSMAVICVAPTLVGHRGVAGIAEALCVSMIVNVWLFPLMVHRAVSHGRAGHSRPFAAAGAQATSGSTLKP